MDQKVVIVTGGGRGIGRATAQAFAEEGLTVVITSRTESQLKETEELIRKNGGEVLAIPGDVSDPAHAERIVEETVKIFHRVDILVNNAAVSSGESLLNESVEHWQKFMEINIGGYFYCAQAVVPYMICQGGGVIINISSIMAHISAGVATSYTASKGAIESVTNNWAVLLGRKNIRVVCVELGAINTNVTTNWAGQGGVMKRIYDHYLDMVPLGREADPREAADVIVYLSSERASFITGTSIRVDGGWMAAAYPQSIVSELSKI